MSAKQLSNDEILDEVRRRLTIGDVNPATEAEYTILYGIADGLFAIVTENLPKFSTGQLADLGSRCEIEFEARMDAAVAHHESGGEA